MLSDKIESYKTREIIGAREMRMKCYRACEHME
jgi:hypothetical protein